RTDLHIRRASSRSRMVDARRGGGAVALGFAQRHRRARVVAGGLRRRGRRLMRAFSRLLDRLAFTPSRNAKLTLMRDYFRQTPDPERGWALAGLTGALGFDVAKPAIIRKAIESRMDPELFHL